MRAAPFLVLGLIGAVAVRADSLFVRTSQLGTPYVFAIDPRSGEIATRYSLPPEIPDVAGGLDGIEWDAARGTFLLSGTRENRIWSVDSLFRSADERLVTPWDPDGIALHDGSLFVKNSDPPNEILYELDPLTGNVLNSFQIPDTISLMDLTSDGEHLWASESSPPRVWRIDPSDGSFDLHHSLELTRPILTAVAWGDSRLWLLDSSSADPAVYTLDRQNGTLTREFGLESGVIYLAAVFRGGLTPIERVSWGEVKRGFLSPGSPR